MNKLLAVIKREYVQRIRSRFFLVTTILGPVMLLVFTVVPSLIMNIKTGSVRIAVLDQTGRVYDRVKASLEHDESDDPRPSEAPDSAMAKSFGPNAQSKRLDAIKAAAKVVFIVEPANNVDDLATAERTLNERVAAGQLEGYVVIPRDGLDSGSVQFYGRNLSDVFTIGKLQERVGRAMVEQRMIDANIAPDLVRQKSEPIKLQPFKAGGDGKEDKGGAFMTGFVVGFLIYITILMYGQSILGAIVEEKETRIAEILFSSVDSFQLLIGKLVGVSLVALTQLSIWGLALAALGGYAVSKLISRFPDISIPHISPVMVVFFFLFFLLGYFLYATIYALVGSMVTTAQEGGQLALPIVFILVAGFYITFPVIRSPDSSFAVWMSMVPFFSPIVMVVRIATQMPPLWEILLSLAIGFGTVILMMWLAARIYRIGMLMYGKKATIPEVLRWIRQA